MPTSKANQSSSNDDSFDETEVVVILDNDNNNNNNNTDGDGDDDWKDKIGKLLFQDLLLSKDADAAATVLSSILDCVDVGSDETVKSRCDFFVKLGGHGVIASVFTEENDETIAHSGFKILALICASIKLDVDVMIHLGIFAAGVDAIKRFRGRTAATVCLFFHSCLVGCSEQVQKQLAELLVNQHKAIHRMAGASSANRKNKDFYSHAVGFLDEVSKFEHLRKAIVKDGGITILGFALQFHAETSDEYKHVSELTVKIAGA